MDGRVEANREVFLHSYFGFMAIGVLFYDHIITLADEASYIWKRPKFASSLFFLLNRYTAFFGTVAITVVSFQSLPSQSCKRYSFYRQLLLVLNQVIVCILLTLRTYAIYGRSRRLLIFMTSFAAVLAVSAVWALIGQHSQAQTNVSGCHMAMTLETGIHLAVAWEAVFVYDTCMVILTLLKTYSAAREHGLLSFGGRLNIVALICRDGAMYFAFMAIANFSNILTFYLAPPLLKGSLATFASCISVTLMSRLMLNLHKSADSGIFTTHALESDIVFTTRIATGLAPSTYVSRCTDQEARGTLPPDVLHASNDLATIMELERVPTQNYALDEAEPHAI